VAFSPLATPASTLNYWIAPSIKPIQGDWFVIQEFLHTVICNNNVALFDYLINYLAHMLQRPHEKPGIMIVFLSGQGCGKGTFYKLLGRIWSRTTLQVCDINEITGQFNAALERNYVVCMDEALFAGDKKSLDKLKSLVTEPKCRIEQKHQPSRSIDSYHRFFASSNHDHFVHVDKDDRRFLFIRVSSVHKQDQIYFDAVNDALDDDAVIAAMMHDLLNLDLTDFNIRKRPLTEEHLSQRLQSLRGFERYWYEVLQSGMLDRFTEWDKPRFISTKYLTDHYKDYDKNAGRYNPIQQQHIASTLKLICPSAIQARKKVLNIQERGYDLPDIKLARKEFETMLGTSVEWEAFEDVAAVAGA
jgi:phage/plasmid-associated DNA primase